MGPFKFSHSLLAVFALGALTPKASQAQEWLRDRRFQEGEGIRTGRFELHPGVGAEFGYDSNWFSRTDKNGMTNGPPGAPIIPATMLRVTPSLTLSSISDVRNADSAESGAAPAMPAYKLKASISATYRELFGDDPISKQRNLSGLADIHLDIAPNRPLALTLAAGYTRYIRPTVFGDPDNSFNMSQPYASIEGIYQPGGGTLDIRLGYTLTALLFEDAVAVGYSNLRHDLSVRTRWKFRPRTSIFQETIVGFVNYLDASRAVNLLSNSTPLRTRIGVNGLVSDRVAALAAVGYGASFIENPRATTAQYDSITGQAELRWYFGPVEGDNTFDTTGVNTGSSLAAGYIRDFQVSYLGDQVGTDKGYASLAYFWGGKVLTSLTGSISYLNYPVVAFQDGSIATQAFSSVRPEVSAYGEYRLSNRVGLTANLSYAQNITDAQIKYTFGNYDLSWSRWQAFGGARVLW